MTEFDYLVVGGGTAGCIVAARLAEDPAVSVGLIEWGPSDSREPRAIDSLRLLQLSGIGPAAVLGAAGVDVRVDLPGVGENLMDHAEGIVVWEVAEPPSRVCATGWDAGALVRLTPEAPRPDITMHFPVEAWVDHVVAYGVEMPPYYMATAPNVAKPRSRGRVCAGWAPRTGRDRG